MGNRGSCPAWPCISHTLGAMFPQTSKQSDSHRRRFNDHSDCCKTWNDIDFFVQSLRRWVRSRENKQYWQSHTGGKLILGVKVLPIYIIIQIFEGDYSVEDFKTLKFSIGSVLSRFTNALIYTFETLFLLCTDT